MIRKSILSSRLQKNIFRGCFPLQKRTFSESHDDFLPKKKDIPEGMSDVLKLIEQQIKDNSIMLYMKGTPSRPQCGFSMTAVRILNAV